MLTFFQVCFYTGVVLTIIQVILGGILGLCDSSGFDFDLDIGSLGIDFALPSTTILLIFVTVFGGMGMILDQVIPALSSILALIIAFVISFIIAFVINRFILVPLKKAENTSTPEEEELIGMLAVVSENIMEGGFGEIEYQINGNSYRSPAKSVEGNYIKRGTEVAICWIKDYVYYVSILDQGGNEDE